MNLEYQFAKHLKKLYKKQCDINNSIEETICEIYNLDVEFNYLEYFNCRVENIEGEKVEIVCIDGGYEETIIIDLDTLIECLK